MSRIIVRHNGRIIILSLNAEGRLNVINLKQYFPDACGLTYNDDGDVHGLDVILGELCPVPTVTGYDVHIGGVIAF